VGSSTTILDIPQGVGDLWKTERSAAPCVNGMVAAVAAPVPTEQSPKEDPAAAEVRSPATEPTTTPPKKPRGFAAMSVEERRVLARKGGKRVHELGRAHVFDSDTASAAGRVAHARGTAYRPPKKGERASKIEPPPTADDATSERTSDSP
jgi:hypothetical protein